LQARKKYNTMQTGRILIADDDAVVRLDLKAMLSGMGHCVIGEADNGETACYLARSLHPDLVILDVDMPKCSGLEAAEIISRERLGAVMLLTAYTEPPMIEQANRAGVLAYLVKPFRLQEIQPAIEIAMARYREMVALEGALDNVQGQIETNRLVGRAKRILIERHGISDQEAFRRLNNQALVNNRTLREIAEAILLTEDMAMAVDSVRHK
jgi:AmiR/NasT family two-component response regulator